MKSMIGLSLAAAIAFATPANAACSGGACVIVINALYADPSDVVIQADTTGPCGTPFFHIKRSQVNFKEMSAMALTAFSTTKRMLLFMKACAGTRNVISHGSVNG